MVVWKAVGDMYGGFDTTISHVACRHCSAAPVGFASMSRVAKVICERAVDGRRVLVVVLWVRLERARDVAAGEMSMPWSCREGV